MCTFCQDPVVSINNQDTSYCVRHFNDCACCAMPLTTALDGEWFCSQCLKQEKKLYETRLEMQKEMTRRGFDQVQRMMQLNPFIPEKITQLLEEYIVTSVSTYNTHGQLSLAEAHTRLLLYLRKKDRAKAARMYTLLQRGPLQKRDVDLIKFLLKRARF